MQQGTIDLAQMLTKLKPGPYMLDVSQMMQSYTAREPYCVVDGIAIVDVCGILINDDGWWDGYGCSTYPRIQAEILGAIKDPDVEGILLYVDSPGGECDNAFETAALIRDAAQGKPVWGIAANSAYSAGYLLISAAQKIYCSRDTGGLGSIGVYMMHMDASKYFDDLGIKTTFIEAGKGKTWGNMFEPLGKDAQAEFQAETDRLYQMFVGTVAANRGLAEDTIINEFGALTYHGGEKLVSMGLADAIGTPEEVLQEFRAALTASKGQASAPAAASAANQMKGANKMANPIKSRAAATASDENNKAVPVATETGKAEKKKSDMPVDDETDDEEEEASEEDKDEKKDSASQFRKGYEAAARVVSVCILAGLDLKAASKHLKTGISSQNLAELLLDSKASEEETTPTMSHLKAGSGVADYTEATKQEAVKKNDASLLAALEKVGKGPF